MNMLLRRAFTGSAYVPQVASLFSSTPYTGNGGAQSITNGLNLSGQGGVVWTAERSANGQWHNLNDTVRGANYQLWPNATNAQALSYGALTPASNGFSLLGLDVNNHAGWSYASWSFVRGARFFDFGTYTGNLTPRTISHSLGVAPGFIVVKRTDAAGSWNVYHKSNINAYDYLALESNSGVASSGGMWNLAAPTAAVFSIGNDPAVNASGGTFVWYAFADDSAADGIVRCGGFTTDGAGSATVALGWQPQYLLFKRRDASTSEWWTILDTARGWTGTDNKLTVQASAEVSGSFGAPNTTGFTIAGQSASANYVYLAIRKP